MYAHPIYWLETFVDPARFQGTCYRAANWLVLGRTTGRGKNAPSRKPRFPVKELLALPLTPRFRELLMRVMKTRSCRRQIDVNLEELDQIIDCGRQTPLSESDSRKLKAALHAMAERLSANRSTEKPRAVLKDSQTSASAQQNDNAESRPAGHGRNSTAEFRGAQNRCFACQAKSGRCMPGMSERKNL
jgi:hypothetical protein